MKIGLYNNQNMLFGNKSNKDIEALLNNFSNSASLIDVVTAYNNNNKNINKVSANYYTMQDYALFLGSSSTMQRAIDTFKVLADSKITSAPKYITSVQNNGGRYSLLVLKIPQLKENVSFIDNKEIVSFEQRAKFVEELERLYRQSGLYNPLILDNPEDICVTKDDKIYFDDWSSLDTFESEAEKNKWFNSLKELLNLETY